MSKPRVIKDYEKLTEEMLEQIKLVYPHGFRRHLVEFVGIDGIKKKGLPFETEEKYYLIRMTEEKAITVIANDDDYDVSGSLKVNVRERLEDKYDDEDHLGDYNSNDDNEFGDQGDISIDELDDDIAEDLGDDDMD